MSGIEWKPPLEKYQIALDMLGRPRLAERTTPFHEAWGLVELRNALVHYKPAWDAERGRTLQMRELLSGKYELSPFPENAADFITMRSMSAGCMKWVVSTSISFLKEFHGAAGLNDEKMFAFWQFAA